MPIEKKYYSSIQQLWHLLSAALYPLGDLPAVYSQCILNIWNFKKEILQADKGNRCEQARKTTIGSIGIQPVLVNKNGLKLRAMNFIEYRCIYFALWNKVN